MDESALTLQAIAGDQLSFDQALQLLRVCNPSMMLPAALTRPQIHNNDADAAMNAWFDKGVASLEVYHSPLNPRES